MPHFFICLIFFDLWLIFPHSLTSVQSILGQFSARSRLEDHLKISWSFWFCVLLFLTPIFFKSETFLEVFNLPFSFIFWYSSFYDVWWQFYWFHTGVLRVDGKLHFSHYANVRIWERNLMFLILGILLSLNKLSTFFLNINLSEVVTAIPWNPETI